MRNMTIFPRLRSLVFIAAVLAIAAPAAPAKAVANPDDAAAFVKTLGESAIAVLTDPKADAAERRRRYRELLDNGFAVKTIARFVLGRYWRIATPDQRDEYLRLFREFVLETYTSRLDNYAGEEFKVTGAQPLDEKDTIVTTEIVSGDGPPIRVDYRVRKRKGEYKIVDVVVEGVSLITTQRQEFASIVNRDGIEGLIALLRKKTSGANAANATAAN